MLEVHALDRFAMVQGVVARACQLGSDQALLRPGDHRHLRTQIGQHAPGQRTRANAFKLDDMHTGQGGIQARAHVPSLRAIRSFMISVVPP